MPVLYVRNSSTVTRTPDRVLTVADEPPVPPPVLRFPQPFDVSGLREAFPDANISTGKAAGRRVHAVLSALFDKRVAHLRGLVETIREAEGGDTLLTVFAYDAARETARTGDFRFLAAAVAAVEAWNGGPAAPGDPADEDPFSL